MSNMFDPTMVMDSSDPMFAAQISQFIQGCAGFAAGATVAVLLRLFARWHISTKMSYDDIAIAISLIPLWALTAVGIEIALHGGLAKDVNSLTTQEEAVYYPPVFVSSILYALSITAAKLSILLLYRRIFTGIKFRQILNVFLVLCIIWCVIVTLIAIFRCNPIQVSWSTRHTINPMSYECIPLTNLYYGTSISNLILDVVINLLPARQIWMLQLPLRQRILLIICLALGMVSIAAGIGRILTIPQLDFSELPGAIAPTETIAMPYLFLIVENAFAIICACLPTYYPLAMWLTKLVSKHLLGRNPPSFASANQRSQISGKNPTMTSASAVSAKWSHRRSGADRIPWTWFGQKAGNQNTEYQVSLICSDKTAQEKGRLIGVTSTEIILGPNSDIKSEGILISQSWSTSTASIKLMDTGEKEDSSWVSFCEVSRDKD